MARASVIDKTKWHSDGHLLPGIFLGWAVKADRTTDAVAPNDAAAVKAGKLGGSSLLAIYDGVLDAELFPPAVRRFASSYYRSDAFLAAVAKVAPKALSSTARLPKSAIAAIEAVLEAAWRASPSGVAETKKAAQATSKAVNAKTAGRKVGTGAVREGALSPKASSRLASLRTRAKKKDVDVEHVLAFAQLGERAAAAPLRALAIEHRWPTASRGYVPLGAWVDAVAIYLEGGVDGVVAAVKAKKLAVGFATGLFEELPTADVASALLALALDAERRDPKACGEALSALAAIIDDVRLDAATARAARELAHRRLAKKLVASDAMTCLGILASVGDASSLPLVRARKPLASPWDGCEAETIRAIERRSKKR